VLFFVKLHRNFGEFDIPRARLNWAMLTDTAELPVYLSNFTPRPVVN
jgi:hypothetical protein